MVKCSFCGKTIKEGTGITFVKKTGSILHFCSSKCMKNYMMKRKPARLKWTSKYTKGTKAKKSSKTKKKKK